MAAAWGQPGVASMLLDRGAELEARDSEGRTALIQAAAMGLLSGYTTVPALEGHSEVVLMLLDRGAELKAKGNDGKTALDVAKQNGLDHVAELLRAKMHCCAAAAGNAEVAVMRLEQNSFQGLVVIYKEEEMTCLKQTPDGRLRLRRADGSTTWVIKRDLVPTGTPQPASDRCISEQAAEASQPASDRGSFEGLIVVYKGEEMACLKQTPDGHLRLCRADGSTTWVSKRDVVLNLT